MIDKKTKFHIHMVSDATGETMESIAKAALVQFKGVDCKKHFWPMVRRPKQMIKILDDIAKNPGLVLFTLVNDDIRSVLIKGCHNLRLPFLSLLDPAIMALGSFFGLRATGLPGQQHVLDENYFNRIDALHFTMAHDDGQMVCDVGSADIVIVGVSRTSKTPTSIYLANRGFRTANIPFVLGCPMPKELDLIKKRFVIGLTASPDRLVKIRTNRLRSLNELSSTEYVDMEKIKEEVRECRKYFAVRGWPVIDATRRSIEETAAAILTLYKQNQQEKPPFTEIEKRP